MPTESPSSSLLFRLVPLLAVLAPLTIVAHACGLNPNPPDGDLYTLDDFVPGARNGTLPLAKHVISPAGTAIALLSDPYTPGASVLQANEMDGINIQPAFSEGQPAAYAITEEWLQWPGPVWALPLYFPVTGFDPVTGAVRFLESPPTPIFSLNTTSRFYSSYWQIYYFVVPPGTNADDYVTSKSILDAKFPLVKGALTFCALGPANTNLAHAEGATTAVHPFTGVPINLRNSAPGWAEGVQINFIDFGRSRFLLSTSSSDPAIVEADALFQFAIRDPATGANVPLDLPRVGGTAPLRQYRPPEIVQGRPQFGSLWHEYLAVLNPPAGAPAGTAPPGFFVPNDHPGLRALVTKMARNQPVWAIAPDSSIDSTDPAILAAYTLRVAANPTQCFGTPNPLFPGGPCVWLDSQTAVERAFSASLLIDNHTINSCPLVMFNGVQVPQ